MNPRFMTLHDGSAMVTLQGKPSQALLSQTCRRLGFARRSLMNLKDGNYITAFRTLISRFRRLKLIHFFSSWSTYSPILETNLLQDGLLFEARPWCSCRIKCCCQEAQHRFYPDGRPRYTHALFRLYASAPKVHDQ